MEKNLKSILINGATNVVTKTFRTGSNINKTICDHLIDEKHTESHRMVVGSIIIFVGVSISKIHVSFVIIHYLLDGVGYAIHGIGLIPFVERLSKHHNETNNKDDTK